MLEALVPKKQKLRFLFPSGGMVANLPRTPRSLLYTLLSVTLGVLGSQGRRRSGSRFCQGFVRPPKAVHHSSGGTLSGASGGQSSVLPDEKQRVRLTEKILANGWEHRCTNMKVIKYIINGALDFSGDEQESRSTCCATTQVARSELTLFSTQGSHSDASF